MGSYSVRKRCADSSTSEKYRHYNGAENYQYDTEMVKMGNIATIILGVITLFFGFYAMVLELKGISNFDQLLYVFIFGLLTYLSR